MLDLHASIGLRGLASTAAVDRCVFEFEIFKVATCEVHVFALEAVSFDRSASAAKHLYVSPLALIEVDAVPGALAEADLGQEAVFEFGLLQRAAIEGAAGHRHAAKVTGAKRAVAELAIGPHCLLEGHAREAAACERAGRKRGKAEVEAGVGQVVRLARQSCRRATDTFAPHVVLEKYVLSAHRAALTLSSKKILDFA